jgi:hypothetical protein
VHFFQPGKDYPAKLVNKLNKFFHITFANPTYVVIFDDVSLVPARVEISGIVFPFLTENHRQGTDRPIVMPHTDHPIPRCMKQDGTEFQSRMVQSFKAAL